jgi:hypothetical protein
MHWIDPACLPETAGVVDCFIMNADGETDGFVLIDGTEIHVPPHLGDAVRNALPPGSSVRVRGVRLRHADMVAAVSVQSEDGAAIVDNGRPRTKRRARLRANRWPTRPASRPRSRVSSANSCMARRARYVGCYSKTGVVDGSRRMKALLLRRCYRPAPL